MNQNDYIENFYEESEEEEAEEEAEELSEESISFCNLNIPESANNCGDPTTAFFAFNEKCSGLYVKACKKDKESGKPIFEATTASPDEQDAKRVVNNEFDKILLKADDTNKEDICKLMSIPISTNERETLVKNLNIKSLADKFGNCNIETINKLKKRCNVHQIQSSQCSIEFVDKLLNSCKNYNEIDTSQWDQEICPEKVNYKNDYFYNWASELDDKNPDEREEYFKSLHPDVDYKDNQERLAWVNPYVFEKIPFLRQEKHIDKELEEDEYYQDKKYIPEIRAMKKCIISNYLAPKNCNDTQETVKNYLDELKNNNELTPEEYNKYNSNYNICNDNIIFEGKMVNRFCDWGEARPINFYKGDNYGSGDSKKVISNDPDIKTYIKSKLLDFGTKTLEDDNDYFSAYTGLLYNKDSDGNVDYIDLKNKICTPSEENSKICKIKKEMYPIGKVDIELGEDSDCTLPNVSSDKDDVSYEIDNKKCPAGTTSECSDSNSCCRCGQRRFYKSLNCKYRKNSKNIYGHGCEDPYAMCVKLATKEQIDNETAIYLSGNQFDTTGIQTSFTSLKLEPQNFLTKPEYLRDRIAFESALNENMTPKEKEVYEKEGIYKCMRCGLRNTIDINPHIEATDEIYSWKKSQGISNENINNFLIFHSQTDGEGNVLDTNCNEDDIAWYKHEKIRLLKYFNQEKSLRGLDEKMTWADEVIEKSKTNIQDKTEEFEEDMQRRKLAFQEIETIMKNLSPVLNTFISNAQQKVQEMKKKAEQDIKDPFLNNKYILYIIGFILFCIIIIIFIF